MAGTTAFDVKKALVRECREDAALVILLDNNADYIWDSSYSGQSRPRKVLWFGEVTWSSDDPVTFGKPLHSREELYNIRMGIEINDYDATQSDANDKAEEILSIVEDLVRDKARLQVPNLVSTGVSMVGVGEGPGNAEGGRSTFVAAQVTIRGRK